MQRLIEEIKNRISDENINKIIESGDKSAFGDACLCLLTLSIRESTQAMTKLSKQLEDDKESIEGVWHEVDLPAEIAKVAKYSDILNRDGGSCEV